ncbi:hypothetical protein PVAND_012045 [Polypedilum vanderplanki]|uniref:RRM domain-containing protein n=1 Tax=Polypedilum vanderplanki TaxID=319348 RepID=A0A9J6CLJ0_POLVA|nr:hypothetical protein PVAND_012045 [Polypedilum vanderplanki]
MNIKDLKRESRDINEEYRSSASSRSSKSSDYRDQLASLEKIVLTLRQQNIIHEERLNNITNELKELKEENSYRQEKSFTLSDTKIYVGNISRRTSLNDLENHFSKYGEIIDAFFFREFQNCRNAFVIFREPSAARKALGDNDRDLHNRILTIGKAREKLILKNDNKENNDRNFKSKQSDSKSRRYRPY